MNKGSEYDYAKDCFLIKNSKNKLFVISFKEFSL